MRSFAWGHVRVELCVRRLRGDAVRAAEDSLEFRDRAGRMCSLMSHWLVGDVHSHEAGRE